MVSTRSSTTSAVTASSTPSVCWPAAACSCRTAPRRRGTSQDPPNCRCSSSSAGFLLWKALPNGRRTHFYNIWAGKRRAAAFQDRLRTDLGQVFALLADGAITAQVAARVPLGRAAEAVRLAESGTVTGKVVLVPDPRPRPEA